MNTDRDASQRCEEDHDSNDIPDGFLEGSAADYLSPSDAPSSEQQQPLIHQAGPYRLIRVLGHGGFGCVYLAEHVESALTRHQIVAVKLLQLSGTQLDSRRFQNELNALRAVSHPNIVSLLDSGSLGPHLAYLAMEYIEGTAIDSFCELHQCSWKDSLQLIIQACHAIEHAHSRGVLHCDLKPSNILVTEQGHVVITDFGLVRFFEESELEGASVSTQLRGTPAYMAPEQLAPRTPEQTTRVSVAVDVFGLAATLYRLLSGKPPRATRSTLSAIAMTASGEPIPKLNLSSMHSPCPRSLIDVIEHGLQASPTDRYANVSQFREDLENVLALRPVRIRRHGKLHHLVLWIRREPLNASVSLIAFTASIACILLLFAWWRSEASRNIQLRESLHEAMNATKAFQSMIQRLAPGEQLSAEARLGLLTTTRDQYGRFVAKYPHDDEMRYKFAQACYILAEYLNEVGEVQRAINEIELAIAEYEHLHSERYKEEKIKFDLFHAFHKLGYLEFGSSGRAKGNAALDRASEYIKELHRSFPDNIDYADCYAANLHAKAKLDYQQLDLDELEKLLREALVVAQRLREHPDSKPQHWKHRMSARIELGKLAERANNPDLALAEYSQAVAHATEAHQQDPTVWNFRFDLLEASTALATFAIQSGRTELGLAELEASQAHLDWLFEHRPDLQGLPVIQAHRDKLRSAAGPTASGR